MKSSLATAILAFFLILGSTDGGQAYDYGPACQWLRLSGKVEVSPDILQRGPLQFTVTYQLPNQRVPATLITNYPLEKPEYYFVLSGFSTDIDGAIFVSPGFFFAKEIVFRYYVKSADGQRVSNTYKTVFNPPNIPKISIPKNKGKDYRCHTDLSLETLSLGSDGS